MPLKGMVCKPLSSAMVRLVIAFNVGGSFTGTTVTVKVCIVTLFDVPPSSTVTEIVAVPNAFATGVSVSVPVVTGLLYVTVGSASRFVSPDRAVIVTDWFSLAGPAVMPNIVTVCTVSSGIGKLAIGFRVGGSLTGLTVTVNVR